MKFFLLQCGCRVGLVWVFFSSSGAAGFRCVFDGSQEEPTDDSAAQPWGCEIRVFLGGVIYGMVGCRGSTATGRRRLSLPQLSHPFNHSFSFLHNTEAEQRGQRGAGAQGGHPAALGEWDPHRTQGLDPLCSMGFPDPEVTAAPNLSLRGTPKPKLFLPVPNHLSSSGC